MRNHRYHVLLALIGVVALVLGISLGRVFACSSGPCIHGGGQAASASGLGDSGSVVVIAGRAMRGMTPGTGAPLNLRLTNQNPYPMSARHLLVTVQEVRAPRSDARRPCTAEDFTVTQAAADLEMTLPAHGSMSLRDHSVRRTAWPRVSMVNTDTNQDGCQQATLTLHYSATGTRVDQ